MFEPSGPSGLSLSWFQEHEVTRSISAPPLKYSSQLPIYTPEMLESWREDSAEPGIPQCFVSQHLQLNLKSKRL